MLGSSVSVIGAYISYTFWVPNEPELIEYNSLESYAVAASSFQKEYEPIEYIRLGTGATVVYRHVDRTTGDTTQTISQAPTFMINRTKQELQKTFSQWDIISFEDYQVVMERTIETLPLASYTMSVIGDFIAIFRGQKANNNLLEITTIPVNHLPQSEIDRLERGVPVTSRNELIRRLEDFST